MDILSVFTLLGGLALFLYGMHVMSSGLEKMAGGRLESILRKITSNPFKSLALGALITMAIQSSSAMTVMLVGLVNSGIMRFGQTIGVIMGSNIGTTMTAWIISLIGIESHNVFLRMLKPENFSAVFAFIGVILLMMSKSGKKRDAGTIMLGFAVLMFGMNTMSGAVKPLANVPEFASILTMFSNPVLGVLVGAVVTGIIQSSSASVGILQALSLTGSLTFGSAIPIIMGQNIGTCVTSLISSIGTNKNARRVAVVHIGFNLIGTVLCLAGFYLYESFVGFALLDDVITPVGIAFVHSVFNVTTTVLLFPFGAQLDRLARIIVKDDKKAEVEAFAFIDERLLASPSFAIAECTNLAVKMANLARDTLLSAIGLVGAYNEKQAETVLESEQTLDAYEDKLGTYLVKLSGSELTRSDSQQISRLLHAIGDFERIGDHAVNILDSAREMQEKKISFSADATRELSVMTDALREILWLTTQVFETGDAKLAVKVEPLEEVIDELRTELKNRHIRRLQNSSCTIELGFVFSDLLANYERVSDHCSNIAVNVIQTRESQFDTHGYLNEMKTSGRPEYIAEFNRDRVKYTLPPPSLTQEFCVQAEEPSAPN